MIKKPYIDTWTQNQKVRDRRIDLNRDQQTDRQVKQTPNLPATRQAQIQPAREKYTDKRRPMNRQTDKKNKRHVLPMSNKILYF